MQIIREESKKEIERVVFQSCGCDYCECSCDSDTLLPEDANVDKIKI